MTNLITRFSKYLTLLILTFPCLLLGQIEAPSTVIEAVIYEQGVKVTREATATIAEGETEIILTDLYSKIDGNSIQINVADERIKMVDFNFSTNYLKQPKTDAEKQVWQDSIFILTREVKWLSQQKEVLQAEEKLIKANSKLDEQRTFSVNELQSLTTFYRERILTIRKDIMDIEQTTNRLNTEKSKYRNQLYSNNYGGKATGMIAMKLAASVRTTTKITVSYFLNTGSWSPRYDVRSKGLQSPLELTYKASISQKTGQDWENIQLSLSTAKPLINNTMPALKPIYAGFNGKSKKVVVDTIIAFDPESYEERVQVVKGEVEVDWSEVSETQTAAQFDIDLAQDVKGDGKPQTIIVKELNLPADYQYFTVPGKNNVAYLVAQVPDYGQYKLLSGTASLYFEKTYLGKSFIDKKTTSDTLNLSLGIDYDVTVERNQKTFSAPKFIGNTVKETIDFEIKIRNNKSEPITINVLDQIPVSTEKNIEVKLLKKDGASFNSGTGELKWQLTLPANITETVSFSYQLKYPKGAQISGKW